MGVFRLWITEVNQYSNRGIVFSIIINAYLYLTKEEHQQELQYRSLSSFDQLGEQRLQMSGQYEETN
jgi:hypothetical protein